MKSVKKITAMLLALLTLAGLCACAGGGGEDTAAQTTPAAEVTTEAPLHADGYILVKDGESLYPIVRGDEAGNTAIDAAKKLNNAVKSICGKSAGIDTDFVIPGKEKDPNAFEILLGHTNRPESAAVEEKLGRNQFAVVMTDYKIVIAAGRDALLGPAVDYFVENYLTAPAAETGEGKVVIKEAKDYYSDNNVSFLQRILTSSDTLSSTCDKVMNIKAPDSVSKNPQGGYFDGEYYYQLFICRDNVTNEAANIDKIVKVDAKTGEVVKVSGELALNHGNDITYVPSLGKLVVVHNNPNRNYLTAIDPETLEIDKRYILPLSIYCADFNEAHNKYVVGISGGQNFRYITPDFKMEDVKAVYASTPRTNGYTTQGCTCDDNFIYFVLYNQNVITVYDWDGNFVTVIELDVGSIEPENISVVDDEIYVTCAQSGATVYRVTPKAKG